MSIAEQFAKSLTTNPEECLQVQAELVEHASPEALGALWACVLAGHLGAQCKDPTIVKERFQKICELAEIPISSPLLPGAP